LTKYRDFEIFGGVKEFVNYRGSEAIVHGPAETGKTIGALYKLHICATDYPNASIVIARKTLSSTYATVLQTFKDKVLHDGASVRPYGGEKPEWYDYPSGARIWITGLDKSSKVLSAEHDIVYVNQAEELMLDDWETLTTRTTGRAGNMPYSQTIGDANPAWPSHWMYHRKPLRIFPSWHKENPALFDQATGEMTEQGQRTMAVLGALTGPRKERLLFGKAAMAEGVVYADWNDQVHLIYANDVPKLVRYVAAQDWGYTHPGVLGVWGLDWDGRMYLVAQIYRTKQTIDWWIARARELREEFRWEAIACDPSEPAYIEQYQAAGLNAVAAYSRVLPGINAVQERLAIADDGLPRFFIVRDCVRHEDETLKQDHKMHAIEQEFPSYVWADRKAKEQPVKDGDDGMDTSRYAVAYVDKLGQKQKRIVRGFAVA
jgi:phage terminase large subunit